MVEVTAQMVRDAYQHNVIDRGIAWVDKRSDWKQGAVGSILEAVGVQPREMFVMKYITMYPLPTGSILATPYEPGVPTDDYPLEAQLDILPHETTHDLDAAREGRVSYAVEYALRKTGRVHREMRANASTGEWARARGKGKIDAIWLADNMRFYGCANEVSFALTELNSMLETVNAGGVVAGMGGELMIRWALAHYPELIVLNPFEGE